jgi:endonuclease/exonuclease/phosphatase family metal-dependent hydrolase
MPRTRARPSRVLRLATYNVLVGGAGRENLIRSVLKRIDADVVALQEVCNSNLATSIAGAFHMTCAVGEPSDKEMSCATALLSSRPVRATRHNQHPGRMLRSHLRVEVETGWPDMPVIGVHCLHLAARFGERAKGEARRMRELTLVLDQIAREPQLPHVLIGDFNSIAPGDDVAATRFFRRLNALRRAGLVVTRDDGYMGPALATEDGDRDWDGDWLAAGVDSRLVPGVPLLPRLVGPLTMGLPQSHAIDRFMGRFIERWTVERLLSLGYVDCFRRKHPRAHGHTCATWSPAARVDYVFATPDLAAKLIGCDVVGDRRWADADAHIASDHFPLVADFSG